jgi:hypothetical protein
MNRSIENLEIDTILEFYNNGSLKHKGLVINNKKEGKHIWYNKNGYIKTIIEYKNDVENGKRMDYFDDSNQIKSIVNFSKGKLTDTSLFYNNNGELNAYFIYKDIWIYKYFFKKNNILDELRILVKPHFLDKHTISEQIFFDSNADTIYDKSRFYRLNRSNNKLNLRYFCSDNDRTSLIIGDINKDFSYNSNLVDTIPFVDIINLPKNLNDNFRFIILNYRKIHDSVKGNGTMIYFTYGQHPKLVND